MLSVERNVVGNTLSDILSFDYTEQCSQCKPLLVTLRRVPSIHFYTEAGVLYSQISVSLPKISHDVRQLRNTLMTKWRCTKSLGTQRNSGQKYKPCINNKCIKFNECLFLYILYVMN